MARRRKEPVIVSLFYLPWWVSAVLAGAVLFSADIIQLLFPNGAGKMGPAVKQGFVSMAENVSPWIAGFLLVVALIVLAKDTYKNRKSVSEVIPQKRARPARSTWSAAPSKSSTYSKFVKSKVVKAEAPIKV